MRLVLGAMWVSCVCAAGVSLSAPGADDQQRLSYEKQVEARYWGVRLHHPEDKNAIKTEIEAFGGAIIAQGRRFVLIRMPLTASKTEIRVFLEKLKADKRVESVNKDRVVGR